MVGRNPNGIEIYQPRVSEAFDRLRRANERRPGFTEYQVFASPRFETKRTFRM